MYFISGLGADRKAFERIKLNEKFSVHYLDWIKPLQKESLNEYAKRLAASIDISQPFAIVGLSMGGMVAAAMTEFLHPVKTILISSLGSANEFPLTFKLGRFFKVYQLIPGFILRKPNAITYWLFGAKTRNEKALMDYLISNVDVHFVRWAIAAILHWKDKIRPPSIFQIHGSADKILPVKYTRPDVIIDGGSHFLVWTKAGEVSRLLEQVLNSSWTLPNTP
ncbi:MAG: alpha/beta hydrolase [Bacteroidota bacterium]|nr:alpha/beta hydrolase [Bacteroidota bacterium]